MAAQVILVVDDEEAILKVVSYALAEEGFEVHTAVDADAAESLRAEISPDLVILDVMLPGKSGLDVARELRAHSGVPIVMLSARADEVDRILGLEFGADDYVTKPFSPRELVSRVKAILRRSGHPAYDGAEIRVGELQLDTASRQVYMRGEPVHVTRTEYDILHHLAESAGRVFSRDEILAALDDDVHLGDERAVDVHIHNIREKIEPDVKEPTYILTVRGFGYRLRDP
jgi:DNA-binding response OmpR family regulator